MNMYLSCHLRELSWMAS